MGGSLGMNTPNPQGAQCAFVGVPIKIDDKSKAASEGESLSVMQSLNGKGLNCFDKSQKERKKTEK